MISFLGRLDMVRKSIHPTLREATLFPAECYANMSVTAVNVVMRQQNGSFFPLKVEALNQNSLIINY